MVGFAALCACFALVGCSGSGRSSSGATTTTRSTPATRGLGSASKAATAAKPTWRATLAGAEVVPPPGDADGAGTVTFTYDAKRGKVCAQFDLRKIDPPINAVIQEGEKGKRGPLVVRFDFDGRGRLPLTKACGTVKKGELRVLDADPHATFLQVDTLAHPNGALRGQLQPAR